MDTFTKEEVKEFMEATKTKTHMSKIPERFLKHDMFMAR